MNILSWNQIINTYICCSSCFLHIITVWYMTVGTIVGTVVAYLLVPMRSLGQDSWKIASALMGSYIGGGSY